jgi:hypothetical protein
MDGCQTNWRKVFKAVKIPILISLLSIIIFYVSLWYSEKSGYDSFVNGLCCIFIGGPMLIELLLGLSVFVGRDMVLNRIGSKKEVLYAGLVFSFIPWIFFMLILFVFTIGYSMLNPSIFNTIKFADIIFLMLMWTILWVGIPAVFIGPLMVVFTIAGGYFAHKKIHPGLINLLVVLFMLPLILLAIILLWPVLLTKLL